MTRKNRSRNNHHQDDDQVDLEQLVAFARNTGADSLEQLARKIADRHGVVLRDEEIEQRRK